MLKLLEDPLEEAHPIPTFVLSPGRDGDGAVYFWSGTKKRGEIVIEFLMDETVVKL